GEFHNDVDLTTRSAAGVVLAGENLSTWNENAMNFRGGNDPQGHSAAWIGWNNPRAGGDKAPTSDKDAKTAEDVKTPAAKPPKQAKPVKGAADQKPAAEESKLK